jgi:hypothetical protein
MRLTIFALALVLAACAPTSDTACNQAMNATRAEYGTPQRETVFEHASGWTTVTWIYESRSVSFQWDASMYIAECEVSTYSY